VKTCTNHIANKLSKETQQKEEKLTQNYIVLILKYNL
jgi:hypothetical protein